MADERLRELERRCAFAPGDLDALDELDVQTHRAGARCRPAEQLRWHALKRLQDLYLARFADILALRAPCGALLKRSPTYILQDFRLNTSFTCASPRQDRSRPHVRFVLSWGTDPPATDGKPPVPVRLLQRILEAHVEGARGRHAVQLAGSSVPTFAAALRYHIEDLLRFESQADALVNIAYWSARSGYRVTLDMSTDADLREVAWHVREMAREAGVD